MMKDLKGSIEVMTILLVVGTIWKSFITYAAEVDFWDAPILAEIWYVIRLAFAIYASTLVLGLLEEFHQLMRKQRN